MIRVLFFLLIIVAKMHGVLLFCNSDALFFGGVHIGASKMQNVKMVDKE